MNKSEKTVVVGTLFLLAVYLVAFNLNVPYHWGHGERLVPQGALDVLWKVGLVLSILTLVICIRDSGRRNLEDRASWVAYMLLLGAVGVPHYFLKYGRRPRA